MNLNINHLAEKFVFNNLKKINYGYLQITDLKGKEYFSVIVKVI